MIPNIKLPQAKAIFRSLGHDVRDLSPCCKATAFKGVCMHCGKPTPMPFYFVSTKPVADEFLVEKEQGFRAKLPVGSEFVAFIP